MQLSETSQYVKDCLERCAARNDCSLYMKLVDRLHECNDMDELRDLLTAMAEWASIIGQHHERFKELLVLLFTFDWEIDDERTMSAFEEVLVSLVTSNAGFVEEAFRLLVRNFIRSSGEEQEVVMSGAGGDDADGSQNTSQQQGDGGQSRQKMVLNHIHKTIHRILRVCPLGCSTLLNVIIECFPRQQQDVQAQTEFAREALRVGEQVPVLQDRLIRMAIKSLLELDLELSSAMSDQSKPPTPFRMEDIEDEQETRKKLRLTAAEQEVAEKVDSMLCILFDYFDEHAAKKRPTQNLFRSVLDSFEKEVLRTGRAKFSQYYIFYVCSAKAAYVDQFLSLLMDRLVDEKENIVVRENASKFLGSYLARAKYISSKAIKQNLQKLNDWLKDQLPAVQTSRSKKKRSLFNSAFQSLVYVIIFKGSVIGGGLNFIENDLPGWQEMCSSSSYRPLQRISKDILDEFNAYLKREREELSGSGSNKLAVSAIEQTAVAMSSSASKVMNEDNAQGQEDNEEGGGGGSHQQPQQSQLQQHTAIVMEFPFDPLVLERSGKRIEPHYQEWYSEAVEEEAEEEEDQGGEEEEEEELDEEDVTLSDASLLSRTIPKPIRIERIRRMLGGAWMRSEDDGGMVFPSPQLRPSTSPVPGLLLGGSQPLPSTAGIPIVAKAIPPARQRTLSMMSTESGQCGSW